MKLFLKRGDFRYQFALDRQKKGVLVVGIAETELANVVAMRGLSFNLKRPFVRWFSGFVFEEDEKW